MKKLLYSMVILSSLATSNGFGAFCCWRDQAEPDGNKKPVMVDVATMTDGAAIVDANRTLIAKEHRNASDITTDELCQIFNYLYLEDIAEARRVNKRWHEATYQGSFDTFVLSRVHRDFSQNNVALSLRRGHNASFRIISFGGFWDSYFSVQSEKNFINFIYSYGHKVEILYLYEIDRQMTNNVLNAIGKTCHNLRYFSCRACHSITDNGIEAVTAGCPLLSHISLIDCMSITDAGVDTIKQKFSHILNVNYHKFFPGKGGLGMGFE